MKPLEIERPWLQKRRGLKIFSIAIAIFIITFALLSWFGFSTEGTVNIQSIEITFSNGTFPNYTYAMGKFTYNAGESVTLYLNIHANAQSQTFHITNIVAITQGFSSSIVHQNTYINGTGSTQIPVLVHLPDTNFAGQLIFQVITEN